MIKTLSIESGANEIPAQDIGEIYERHYDMLYRVSYSYVKNTEDTKDIISEVFLKLIQKKIEFDNAEHEKAWLLRAAINLCKDYLKHWSRKNEDIGEYTNLEGADPIQENEMLKIVMDLPDRYRDVIYLYYYEGYNSEEIAKLLKKPHSTVRYHLQEAKKYLKGVLENEK